MPSKVSQSPRSRRNRLERIDIDELFDSPSNRGMLSFLERAPEEARARLEERRKVDSAEAALTSLPLSSDVSVLKPNSGPTAASKQAVSEAQGQLADESDDRTSAKDGSVLQGGYDVNSGSSWPIFALAGDSPPGVKSPTEGKSLTEPMSFGPDTLIRAPQTDRLQSATEHNLWRNPATAVSTGGDLPSVGGPPTRGDVPLLNELSSRVPRIESPKPKESRYTPSRELAPVGNSPAEADSPPPPYTSVFKAGVSKLKTAAATYEAVLPTTSVTGVKLPTDVIDGTIIGRRQKIRRAVVAQDGHSSGEQLLYQALWNAARPESGSLDRRIIVAGYQGMSALCKLDKKNCKKNAKGLIDKLALEVAETYRSNERIGTTYRIFSYKEILRRREEAGMIWVVRTSGVRFVPLTDKDPQTRQGVTHPEGELSRTNALLGYTVGKSPSEFGNSPTDPVGNWSTESVGDSPRHAIGETPTLLERTKNKHQETSSAFPRQLGPKLRALLPSFDDDAARQLWIRCYQIAPDCTEEDIEYCFQIKAHQLLRGRKKIDNPVGIMIWSVPKTFEGTDPLYLRRRLEIERIRKAEEDERQRSRATLMEMLEDPRTPAEDKVTIHKLLEEQ